VQIGLLYTAFFLTTTLVAIPGGLLADRFELRTIIVLDWLLVFPAVILFYLARSWTFLLLGQIVAGLSMLNSPAMSVYVTRRVPRNKINTAFAFLYSSFPLGMVVSPAIGGYLANLYGIKNVFLIAAFFFLISSIIIAFISPEKHRPLRRTSGLIGSLKDLDFQKLIAFFTLLFLIDAMIVPFISPYLNTVKNFRLTQIGLAGAAISLGAAVLGPLLGRLADRAGGRRAISYGLILISVSLLIILTSKSIWPIMISLLIYGLFNGIYSIARGMLSLRVRNLPLGVSYGVFGAVSTGASFVGPLLSGVLYETAPALPFALSAGLALTFALVLFIYQRL
jgi:MFS family permease